MVVVEGSPSPEKKEKKDLNSPSIPTTLLTLLNWFIYEYYNNKNTCLRQKFIYVG